MNFRYRLMQFMSGRYGIDMLFYVIFVAASALSIINCFVRIWPLQIVVYALVVYAFFRVLSRNTAARARENQQLCAILGRIRDKQNIRRRRHADFTHIYKKCPACRAVLRLPRRKGKHTTVCPKCNKKFTVRVFKD